MFIRVLFLLLLLSSSAAQAEIFLGQSAHWSVFFTWEETTRRERCAMSTYSGRSYFGLLYNKNASYIVVRMHDVAWDMRPGERVSVLFQIDGNPMWMFMGEAIRNNVVDVELQPDVMNNWLAQFRSGRALSVSYLLRREPGLQVSLRGSNSAVRVFLECATMLMNESNRAQGNPPPFVRPMNEHGPTILRWRT